MLNPPASEEQISALSSALGCQVAELESFYRRANGMADGATDAHLVAVWSIEKILDEHKLNWGSDANGPYCDWAFGDVLIYSHLLAVRLRGGLAPTYVVDGYSARESSSLETFFGAYLEDPCEFGTY